MNTICVELLWIYKNAKPHLPRHIFYKILEDTGYIAEEMIMLPLMPVTLSIPRRLIPIDFKFMLHLGDKFEVVRYLSNFLFSNDGRDEKIIKNDDESIDFFKRKRCYHKNWQDDYLDYHDDLDTNRIIDFRRETKFSNDGEKYNTYGYTYSIYGIGNDTITWYQFIKQFNKLRDTLSCLTSDKRNNILFEFIDCFIVIWTTHNVIYRRCEIYNKNMSDRFINNETTKYFITELCHSYKY